MTTNMIEIYPNAFDTEYCQTVIDIFERMHSEKLTIPQRGLERNSDDRVMYDWSPHNQMHYYHHDIVKQFYQTLHLGYEKYASKYEVLQLLAPHSPKGMCVQRTAPTQGYHTWHCESAGNPSSSRVLAYTLYLNDVEDGGETEYLYQQLKVKPSTGTLVLWPAFFTHPHRGNPPYSGNKYIITGWYTYDQ
jgi:hypothetical protein